MNSLNRLHIMKHQEDTLYRSTVVPLALHADNDDTPDSVSRDRMVTWIWQVVEHFQFSHETVEIALNYVDRFTCHDRVDYQLTCMTALYTAVKIHEHTAIPPAMMAQLSHGLFSTKQIVQHERKLLSALQWRMHPPTTLSFVRVVVPSVVPRHFQQAVYELAVVQLQQSVRVALLRTVPAYVLAYAAILNAVECLNDDDNDKNMNKKVLRNELKVALGIDLKGETRIRELQSMLNKWVLGDMSMAVSPKRQALRASSTSTTADVSPRTVV